jgi:hypothetical protein
VGAGTSMRCNTTRLHDSPGLSLRRSRKFMARRARSMPRQAMHRPASSARSSSLRPSLSAASPMGRDCSIVSVRSRSSTVRASVVTR